jgi:hypothetical protein
MLATAAALVLACMPYRPSPPPPPVATITCEGADQVHRSHDGLELRRVANACTTLRCEGSDRVRRTYDGLQVSRQLDACAITRCEGVSLVTRTSDGRVLRRQSDARRCAPVLAPIVSRPPTPDTLRFGLTAR